MSETKTYAIQVVDPTVVAKRTPVYMLEGRLETIRRELRLEQRKADRDDDVIEALKFRAREIMAAIDDELDRKDAFFRNAVNA